MVERYGCLISKQHFPQAAPAILRFENCGKDGPEVELVILAAHCVLVHECPPRDSCVERWGTQGRLGQGMLHASEDYLLHC